MRNYFAKIYNFFKQKHFYLLAVIILAQLAVISYYGFQKKNFHMDEIGTLSVSNSRQPVYNVQNEFISSQKMKNSLKIESSERFHYDFVYKNSKKDTGIPPLHALLVHTAYSIHSFFSDNFSRWPGIILNMCFFVFASVILYLVSRFIFNPGVDMLPNLLWGFSSGVINSVCFIRMYTMSTLFFLLLLYIVFNIIRNKNTGLKDYIFLSLTIYFGILTHYHFVVWAFLVLAAYFAAICRRKIPVIVKSFISVVSAVVLSCISFPVISNSLNSMHKKWLGENICSSVNFENIIIFFNLYTEEFLGINIKSAAIAVLLIVVALVVKKIYFLRGAAGNKTLNFKTGKLFVIDDKRFFVFCTALSFIFIVIVAYTSKYKTARYIWPVAPVSIIFCLAFCKFAIDKIFSYSVFIKRNIFIFSVLALSILGFLAGKHLSDHFNKNDMSYSISLKCTDLDIVYVSGKPFHFMEAVYTMSNFNSAVFIKDEEQLIQILNELQKKQKAAIATSERDGKQYIGKILKKANESGWEIKGLLFTKGTTKAYVMQYLEK